MARDRSKDLGDGEKWVPAGNPGAGRRVVSDQNLIRWEFYNRNNCTIIFHLMPEKIPYIHSMGILVGLARIECPPEGFVVLNHSFYIPHATDGRPQIVMHRNVGRWIGKGMKHPSKPVND